MAVDLKFTITKAADCKSWTFTETTGAYDASTNTGGWGSPNDATTDATSAKLCIKNNTTGITYDEIDLYATTNYPTTGSTTHTINVSDLKVGGTAITDTKIPDGVWCFEYKVVTSITTPASCENITATFDITDSAETVNLGEITSISNTSASTVGTITTWIWTLDFTGTSADPTFIDTVTFTGVAGTAVSPSVTTTHGVVVGGTYDEPTFDWTGISGAPLIDPDILVIKLTVQSECCESEYQISRTGDPAVNTPTQISTNTAISPAPSGCGTTTTTTYKENVYKLNVCNLDCSIQKMTPDLPDCDCDCNDTTCLSEFQKARLILCIIQSLGVCGNLDKASDGIKYLQNLLGEDNCNEC